MPQNGEQQLLVIAHYTDGSTEDVTEHGEVRAEQPGNGRGRASTGLVKTLDLTGDVADHGPLSGPGRRVPRQRPAGRAGRERLPPPKNFIDELVFAKLKTLGVPPSAVCDDATFLRRAALDIAGRLPTPEETEQFLADTDPDKRDAWIDTLLASTDYADYLRQQVERDPAQQAAGRDAMPAARAIFHDWIRDSLHANKPYDQFVRQLLTATGEIGQNPPVAWYREVEGRRTSRSKTRPSCSWACASSVPAATIIRSRSGASRTTTASRRSSRRCGRKPGAQFGEERVFHNRGVATATNPKTEQARAADRPGRRAGSTWPPTTIRGSALVDWMVSHGQPVLRPARW